MRNKDKSSHITHSIAFLTLIILCSLFLVTCDLLSVAVDKDFYQKIDDEVAWANAPKISVRIEYPGAWGTSSPSVGPVSLDIRQSYAFNAEFTPDPAFSLQGWRAYATSVLSGLGDWRLDQTLLDGVPTLSGVLVPNLPSRGGKGSFTINTTVPVTLVPWCGSEPYVVRTEPRSSRQGLWHVENEIAIHFNAPLDPDMDWQVAVKR